MKHSFRIATVLFLGVLSGQASSAIYKCVDDNGSVQFQDRPCPGMAASQSASQAGSQELSPSSLSGRWAIVKVGDVQIPENEIEEDVWVFTESTMEVYSGGRGLRPDSYSIEGNTLKFDYFKVDVLNFDGKQMEVKTGGINQTLRKLQ